MLIVGLGNPGNKYQNNRHNIGFIILDLIASQYGFDDFSYDNKFAGEFSKGNVFGKQIFAIKPMTYMNLSGDPVQKVINYYKLDKNKLLIIQDDLDFDVGVVKLRFSSSAGGHNGIKDIKNKLGLDKIRRLKIGIGRPPNKDLVTPYVLGDFTKSQLDSIVLQKELIFDLFESFIKNN